MAGMLGYESESRNIIATCTYISLIGREQACGSNIQTYIILYEIVHTLLDSLLRETRTPLGDWLGG